jgi:hypothetical protein
MKKETQYKEKHPLQSTTASLDHNSRDLVRASVGGGTTILKVPITFLSTRPGNTDRRTAVRNTGGEGFDIASLVFASKTEGIVVTVDGDVLLVALLEGGDGLVDVLHAALFPHGSGGEVGVETGTVPVTGDRLGVERDLDAEILSDTVEEVTGNPKVVTHLDTLTRANLELPLRRKNLGIDTGDLYVGIKAGTVVGLHDITAVDLAGSDTAVVGALGTRETALGPAIGCTELVEKGVLLLETEPGLLALVGLHELVALMSVVVLVRGAVRVPAFAEDEDVVTATERIGKDGDRAEVDIGVVAGGLGGRRTVEVPLREILNGVDLFAQSLGFTPDAVGTVNPDVLGLNGTPLVKVEVFLQSSSVGDNF